MTRLLLMHSIAIITALCLLATPTEAPLPKGRRKRNYTTEKQEDRKALLRELQTDFDETKKRIVNCRKSGLMQPIPEHTADIRALTLAVFGDYIRGFDIWWGAAVGSDVITEVFRDHANAKRVKNALQTVLREPNDYSPDIEKSYVYVRGKPTKYFYYNLKGGSEDEANKEMRDMFLYHALDAGEYLQNRLASWKGTGRQKLRRIVWLIVAWLENMDKLTIATFKHDVRILVGEYKCQLDRWGDANLAHMATNIDNSFFRNLKASVERRKAAADVTFDEERYKALEYRLKVFALLGQIHDQWYKLHELLSRIFRIQAKEVAGQIKRSSLTYNIDEDKGTTA